jgi:hypothetical protein
MKKNIIFLVFGILFLVSASFIFYLINKNNETKKICFKDDCFLVELAQSPKEHNRGLMFRESLPEKGGMLFIFQENGIYPFWMKNTLIPLDMIWIDENKKVVFIEKNTTPCKEDVCPSINPQVEARYVLEINAGVSETLNIAPGSKLEF